MRRNGDFDAEQIFYLLLLDLLRDSDVSRSTGAALTWGGEGRGGGLREEEKEEAGGGAYGGLFKLMRKIVVVLIPQKYIETKLSP